jgi:MoaA/NifB/PqqE/SkfB family radical SAM enzyme
MKIVDQLVEERIEKDKFDDLKIRVTLVDPNNWEPLDLIFDFENSSIAKKWAAHLCEIKNGPHTIRESSLKHTDNLDMNEMMYAIHHAIDTINSFYDQPILKHSIADKDALNYWHECYEKYGVRLDKLLKEDYWSSAYQKIPQDSILAKRWPGINFNTEMHEGFIRLNECIHRTELFNLEKETNPYPTSGILTWSLWPRIDFELEESDWENMKWDDKFGSFYLGYNTLGKNLSHIVLDQDHEAIDRGAIIPQTTWSTEVFVNLKRDVMTDHKLISYKKSWDNLKISEKTNHIFGEFIKNREGYIRIGLLNKVCMRKYYDESNRIVKIPFSKYSAIYNIEIISKEVAESVERYPRWKSIPEKSETQQIKVVNPRNMITWILNNACTYHCRYCPESLHNGVNTKWSWDIVEPFLDEVLKNYGFNTTFALSGGEPTISPFFPQLIRKIHEKGATTGITTNLSRSERFIKDNHGFLEYAACSFHPSMVFPAGESQHFIDKVILSQEYTITSIRIMMDPNYWEETLNFIEELKKQYVGMVSLVWIQDQYGGSRDKICELSYTKEQQKFINEWKWTKERLYPVNYRHLSELKKDQIRKTSSIYYYKDGIERNDQNPQNLINLGETRYFDWDCNIGKESLFISHDGNIRRGNCHVGGTIGNIESYKKINWNSLTRSVRCSEGCCICGADVPIGKVKNF